MAVLVFDLGVISLIEAEHMSLRRLIFWNEQATPYLKALAKMQQEQQN